MAGIKLKRVYDEPQAGDGCRILVERLWPRGLAKHKAQVDLWLRDVAPSSELRKWFSHDPGKWKEFKKRYFNELAERNDALLIIREKQGLGSVTFVYASRETNFNNAVALKEYLDKDRAGARRK